jgi:hypothetical protein
MEFIARTKVLIKSSSIASYKGQIVSNQVIDDVLLWILFFAEIT